MELYPLSLIFVYLFRELFIFINHDQSMIKIGPILLVLSGSVVGKAV